MMMIMKADSLISSPGKWHQKVSRWQGWWKEPQRRGFKHVGGHRWQQRLGWGGESLLRASGLTSILSPLCAPLKKAVY